MKSMFRGFSRQGSFQELLETLPISEILDHLWNDFRVVRLVQVSLHSWFFSSLVFSFGSENVPFELICFSNLCLAFIYIYNFYIFMIKALEGNLA